MNISREDANDQLQEKKTSAHQGARPSTESELLGVTPRWKGQSPGQGAGASPAWRLTPQPRAQPLARVPSTSLGKLRAPEHRAGACTQIQSCCRDPGFFFWASRPTLPVAELGVLPPQWRYCGHRKPKQPASPSHARCRYPGRTWPGLCRSRQLAAAPHPTSPGGQSFLEGSPGRCLPQTAHQNYPHSSGEETEAQKH